MSTLDVSPIEADEVRVLALGIVDFQAAGLKARRRAASPAPEIAFVFENNDHDSIPLFAI